MSHRWWKSFEPFVEIVMKIILLLAVLVIGSAVGMAVDSLLGIQMNIIYGTWAAAIHDVTAMFYGASILAVATHQSH